MSDDHSPEGWVVKQLGTVATTQLGKAIDPTERGRSPQLPYLRNANVQWDNVAMDDVATMYFSAAERARYRLNDGDLLVCEGGIIGRSAIWREAGEPHFFQNALHRVRAIGDDVSNEWILENLRWLTLNGALAEVARGNTILHLSQQSLRALPIVVPPRETADGLMALLRTADDRKDSAASHVSAAGAALERFRQAVLAAACSGRLTADWRDLNPGAGSASEEFAQAEARTARVRRGVDPTEPATSFENLPSTWSTFTVAQLLARGLLEDVKDGNHGANHPKVSEFTDEGLPFITANLVRAGRIDYDAAPRVAGDVLGRLRVGFSHPGDVVLTHKGTVGRVALATQEAVLTPQTTYYRSSGLLNPEYLSIFLASLQFYEQLARVMSQTTRDFVPITQQYKLTIIVPPSAEQREIVKRTESLLTVADRMQKRISNASRNVARTAQAVLGKAFRGELTTSGVRVVEDRR